MIILWMRWIWPSRKRVVGGSVANLANRLHQTVGFVEGRVLVVDCQVQSCMPPCALFSVSIYKLGRCGRSKHDSGIYWVLMCVGTRHGYVVPIIFLTTLCHGRCLNYFIDKKTEVSRSNLPRNHMGVRKNVWSKSSWNWVYKHLLSKIGARLFGPNLPVKNAG